jgi:hypothetical protein
MLQQVAAGGGDASDDAGSASSDENDGCTDTAGMSHSATEALRAGSYLLDCVQASGGLVDGELSEWPVFAVKL